jgi:hypothetical protein
MNALFEVFYQPGKLFASLPERKLAWLVPMIAATLLGLVGYYAVTKYIGRENIARQSMQMFASRMSPEQVQQAVARANSPAQIYIGYASVIMGVSVVLLIVAGALMAFGMMTKRAPGFGSMLAMVALANFPYALVSTLMTWLTLAISPDPTSLDFQHLLATNVGAFMNRNETSKGLYSLMTSLDILTFAEIFLLSLGFSKLTKAKLGAGLGAVLTLWILWVFAKMGMSLAFGN